MRRQITAYYQSSTVRVCYRRRMTPQGNHLGWRVQISEYDKACGKFVMIVDRPFFVLSPSEAVSLAFARAEPLFLGGPTVARVETSVLARIPL